MKLLRVALRWQAVIWAATGAALVLAPGWVVESAMSQPPLGQDAWLRFTGVAAVALAAQMVLVGNRIEEHWWWSWTFALLEIASATVLVTAGVIGRPPDAATWTWWAVGGVHALVAAVEVAALARAGTERSPA